MIKEKVKLTDYFWHKFVDIDRFGFVLWSLLVFVIGIIVGYVLR